MQTAVWRIPVPDVYGLGKSASSQGVWTSNPCYGSLLTPIT